MKILRKTTKKNIAFIQLKDLDLLKSLKIKLPIEIEKLKSKYSRKEKIMNRTVFVPLESEEAFDFLVGCDLILDYDRYINLSETTFKSEIIKISKKIREYCTMCETGNTEKMTGTEETTNELIYTQYKFMSLKELYDIRKGKSNIILPIETEENKKYIKRKKVSNYEE